MKRAPSGDLSEQVEHKKQRTSPTMDSSDDECLPFAEEDRDKFLDVEWLTSHLQPHKIIWSSNHDKIKPNLDPSMLGNEENEVVNTWFVQSPTLSKGDTTLSEEDKIKSAAKIVQEADAILIVAGAGIGVDSGLPDYRGPNGFWRAYPKLKDAGLSLEGMSHPDWFENKPRAAWGFYGHRAELYHSAKPHDGFRILRDICRSKNDNYFVFTSNIDSQFQKAGFADEKVFEAHGCLLHLQCVNEQCHHVWRIASASFPKSDKDLQLKGDVPMCPECGSIARPNVSMFGDTNLTWVASRSKAQKKRFKRWLKGVYGPFYGLKSDKNNSNIKRSKLAVFDIGCGLSLHSLRLEVDLLCTDESKEHASAIRINPANCSIKGEHNIGIPLGALGALSKIQKAINYT